MSMKLNDFLRSMLKKVGIKEDEETKKLLDTEAFDLDLPDFITTPIETKTFDFHSARNNQGIRDAIIAERFSAVEEQMKTKIKEVFGLSEDKFNELRGNPKERAFNEFLGELLPTLKASVTPEPGKRDDKSEQTVKDLQTKLADISKEYESFKSSAAQKEKELLTDWKLRQMVSGYGFRDDLGDIADDLKNTIIGKIKQNMVIKDVDGQLLPFSKQDENVQIMTDKNELRTVKDIIEEHVRPYLKKSNTNEPDKPDTKIVVDKKELVKKMHTHGSATGIGNTMGMK